MTQKTLYELKKSKDKKKENTVTDADYRLRDKAEEAKKGYPNTLDITPVVIDPETVVTKTPAKSK